MTAAATEGILPNVRKLFIPDRGKIICDADLAGADAQVVAWEAEDEDLKDAFRKGLKVHDKNATDMWGERYTGLADGSPAKEKLYKQNKQGVHAINYGVSARTLAIILGWTIAETNDFKQRWLRQHPGIGRWHRRTEHTLKTQRQTIYNIFGYRRVYFDRIDGLLPEALAWVPQSTVGIVCERGGIQVDEELDWVEILLQVHDSLVFQIPKSRINDLPLVQKRLTIECPYSDPLIIPWGLSISDKSWGDVVPCDWENAKEVL